MSISIGIDLGTTYSAAAYVNSDTGKPEIIQNPEGQKITPSVIRFWNGEPVFGAEAEDAFNAGESGCAATFKRNMGKNETYCTIDGVDYTAEKLSSMLLRYIKDYVESETGEKIKDAVITVPAYFYAVEREATVKAAEEAGLKVKKIIDEPNAAAIAYGLNHWRENANILVYDLGGGTFDVTLIHMHKDGELQTVVTRGDHFLGGRDWDNRLEKILINKFADETGLDIESDTDALKTIRGLSEGIKKQFSKMPSVTATANFTGYGRASVKVTREEFEDASIDLLRRTGDFCRAVLDEAGLNVDDVTDVLLVGGSTRMLAVSNYLAEIFGKKPIAHVNPDEAVALGAAVQATKENSKPTQLSITIKGGKKVTDRGKISGLFKPKVKAETKITGLEKIKLVETTAHAMGMIAVSQDGTRYINDIIIPANHPRPVRAAKAFSFRTSPCDANEMEIYVIQGDKEAPLENSIPYRYIVTGIEYKRENKGKATIKVQYTYDNNGIIHVEARQDNSNKNLSVRREFVPDDMSKFSRPVEATAAPLPDPLNVAMAVDVSGSMSGEPLRDAKKAMRDFIDQLDFSYTRVAVMVVSDRVKIKCKLTSNPRDAKNAVDAIRECETGVCNDAHPFDDIKKLLRNEDGNNFAIILADGVWDYQDEAVKVAKECNRAGIETAAIGFGDADEAFLHDVSSSDANAIFVAGSSDLGAAFGTIAQSLGGSSSISGQSGSATDIETWES